MERQSERSREDETTGLSSSAGSDAEAQICGLPWLVGLDEGVQAMRVRGRTARMHRRWTLRSRGHRVAAALLLAGTISLAGFGATISLASPTAESNGKTALTQRMLSSLYT